MTLALCEIETVSSRFWTRVAVSISYDDNPYNTIASILESKFELQSHYYVPFQTNAFSKGMNRLILP